MIYELNLDDKIEVSKIKKFLADNSDSDYMQSIEWNIIRNEKTKYTLLFCLFFTAKYAKKIVIINITISTSIFFLSFLIFLYKNHIVLLTTYVYHIRF